MPFERVLGVVVGRFMQQLHESNRVSFRMQAVVSAFLGTDGVFSGVQLKNGPVVEADICIIGAGVSAR